MGESLGMEGFGDGPGRVVAAVNGNGSHRAVAAVTPLTEAQRELYLQDLLAAFERGELDAYEYTNKAQGIQRANSMGDVARVLNRSGAAAQAQASPQARPAPDPVDIALMSASAKNNERTPNKNRYLMLVVVAIIFIVLIVVGILLDARLRSAEQTPGSGAAAAYSRVYGYAYAYAPGSVAPVSPLSPRR